MLKQRKGLARLRCECQNAAALAKRKLLICTGAGCVSSGSLEIYARLAGLLKERGLAFEIELAKEPRTDGAQVRRRAARLLRDRPLVRVEPEDWLYTRVKVSDCEEIIDKTIAGGRAHRTASAVAGMERSIPARTRSRFIKSRGASCLSTAAK
jgi:NADH-quinone oxidoreductase subunit F